MQLGCKERDILEQTHQQRKGESVAGVFVLKEK